MKYSGIKTQVRAHALQQPRGRQVELARRIKISPASVAQKLMLNNPRQIPDQLHIYLDALGFKVVIRSKKN